MLFNFSTLHFWAAKEFLRETSFFFFFFCFLVFQGLYKFIFFNLTQALLAFGLLSPSALRLIQTFSTPHKPPTLTYSLPLTSSCVCDSSHLKLTDTPPA